MLYLFNIITSYIMFASTIVLDGIVLQSQQ